MALPEYVGVQMTNRTDGTDLTSAVTVRVKFAGGAWAAPTNTPAHTENGWWEVQLNGTERANAQVQVKGTHATGVTETRSYVDPIAGLTLSNGAVDANVTRWRDVVPLALTSQRVQTEALNVQIVGPGAISPLSFQANAISAGAIATDAIGADEFALSAANKVRDTILSDSSPFAGANINATVGSRATPADVLAQLVAHFAAQIPVSPAPGSYDDSYRQVVDGTQKVGDVTNDVGGKVLGGGASTITGVGARVQDENGVQVASDQELKDQHTTTKTHVTTEHGTTRNEITVDGNATRTQGGAGPWTTAAGFSTHSAADVAAAVRAIVVESQGSYTLQQALSIILSVLAGVTSDSGATVSTPNGLATRAAATINASQERTAMTLTPSS